MNRKVKVGEQVWRVVRDPGVNVGARAESEMIDPPGPAGLWFIADDGERRFVAMDVDLPTQTELDELPLDQFVELIMRAERGTQGTGSVGSGT